LGKPLFSQGGHIATNTYLNGNSLSHNKPISV